MTATIAEPQPVFALHGASKPFEVRNVVALEHVDLTLAEGEFASSFAKWSE